MDAVLVHISEEEDTLLLTYYDRDTGGRARTRFQWIPAIGAGITLRDDRSDRVTARNGYWAVLGTGTYGSIDQREAESKAIQYISNYREKPVLVPDRSTSHVYPRPDWLSVATVRNETTHLAHPDAETTICGALALPVNRMIPGRDNFDTDADACQRCVIADPEAETEAKS